MLRKLIRCLRYSHGSRSACRDIKVGPQKPAETVFCNNSVTTAKYNMLSFVPRALFEQFRRLANVYFLLISVLMLVGKYTSYYESPLDPWSTLIPLLLVLTLSMCKEGAEDLKRHRADKETNNRIVRKLMYNSSNVATDCFWQDILVGDLILLDNNSEIPADMILLCSSDNAGAVYIETSNIDGETNLKIKCAARTVLFGSAWETPTDIIGVNFEVHCEHPNSSIHSFNGTVAHKDKEIAVDASNFLLRGSTLRNTSWCVGVVVYTGCQTKIVLNSRGAPSKMSTIEKTMNNLIYVIFSAQVLLSTISLICYIVWNTYHFNELTYLCYNYEYSTNPVYRDFCSNDFVEYSFAGYFFTFFILYNNFLPISLYMTVEFCNYVQAYYIDNDLAMYDTESDTPALARTSNMNGDLGMVDYIFCDKTGTLTQNEMRFQKCSINDRVFGETVPELSDADASSSGGSSLSSLKHLTGLVTSVYAEFAFAMAIAHTVVIDRDAGCYQAESPDEEALVSADIGWKFVQRNSDKVVIKRVCEGGDVTIGTELTFQIIATIPFDSTRKRMSVVVVHPVSGDIVVYCKGADNVIFDRASAGFSQKSSRVTLDGHLSNFATDGLRTLVLATRVVEKEDYQRFLTLWQEAQRVVVGRKELMHKAAALIERDLTVLGATAIEDRLQDGVPEAIADLRNAGVKLWVLTGDKIETAVNIAYSCKLIVKEMILIRLHETGDDIEDIIRHMVFLLQKLKKIATKDKYVEKIWDRVSESMHTAASERSVELNGATLRDGYGNLENVKSEHLALIVDGDILSKLLGNAHAENVLLVLARLCRSVLACRVSPEQKRLLVRLVKKGVQPHPITLAIGDGANDVAMIQEAHIGVGISGKEGRQAVNSSDFAIAQFRFLKRLMLVHGRTDYRRISKVVLYSFYKNIVLTFIIFFFTFFSGYSGQSLFDDYIYSSFNFILMTPVLGFGIFDKDLSPETLEIHSALYALSREGKDMSIKNLALQLAQAILESLIIFFVPFGNMCTNEGVKDGQNDDGIWVFGTIVFTCLIVSQLVRCAWLTYTWTLPSVLFLLGSLVVYVSFILLYQYVSIAGFFDFYKIANHALSLSHFWFLCLLVPVMTIAVDVAAAAYQRAHSPTLLDACIEYDRGYGMQDKQKCNHDIVGSEAGDTTSQILIKYTLGSLPSSGFFSLDWQSLKDMYAHMGISEREVLGIHNTAEGPVESSFNFDFVTRELGPGAGYVFLSSALNTVGTAIFGAGNGTAENRSGTSHDHRL